MAHLGHKEKGVAGVKIATSIKMFKARHGDAVERDTAMSIAKCERAFKRKDLALARLHMSAIPDPSRARIIYQPNWDTHCLNPRHVTFLHLAAENGWNSICRELIRVHRCRPDITDDQGFYTPLHYAIGGNQINTLQFFIAEQYCDLQRLDLHCSITPLQLACSIGNVEITDYLLTECNCNPNRVDTSFNTPLHHAVLNGHLDTVLSLFATGKIKQLHCNDNGDTVLHLAARMGHYQIFVCTLSHVEVSMNNCRNNIGDTPLHEAARNGYSSIVSYIMQTVECDITSRNSLRQTPIDEAQKHKHTDIVRMLKEPSKTNHL